MVMGQAGEKPRCLCIIATLGSRKAGSKALARHRRRVLEVSDRRIDRVRPNTPASIRSDAMEEGFFTSLGASNARDARLPPFAGSQSLAASHSGLFPSNRTTSPVAASLRRRAPASATLRRCWSAVLARTNRAHQIRALQPGTEWLRGGRFYCFEWSTRT